MPAISIILPVYKTEPYLRDCLDSLINQTLDDIEIIAINDGSPDNCQAILEEYALKDGRVKVINCVNNRGLSEARNIGLEEASGDYIMFVDSDDWIDGNSCETVYKAALREKVDAVLFGYISESPAGSIQKQLFQDDKLFTEEMVKQELFQGLIGLIGKQLAHPERLDILVSACSKLYKNQVIQDHHIRYISLKKIPSECQLFNMQFFSQAKSAVYIDKYFYHYRRDNVRSLTKGYRENLLDKWLYWQIIAKDMIDANRPTEAVYSAYYSRICCSLIPLSGNSLKQKSLKKTYREMKSILRHPSYVEAFSKLEFQYFPIHWYVYFYLAKKQCVFLSCIMSILMVIAINFRLRFKLWKK